MNNEIVRYTKKGLAKSDSEISNSIGNSALVVGGGGLVLYAAAALIPFVNMMALLIAAVAFGVYLKVK